MLLLVLIFILAFAIFLRFSETVMAALMGTVLLGLAFYQISFSDLSRAGGVIVGSLLVASSALVLIGLPMPMAARKGPKRKAKAPPFQFPFFKRPEVVRQTSTGMEVNLNIAGYEIYERVGVGGMACVYRARRMEDNRPVALKIPLEKFVTDAKFVRRFHREAEVLRRLSHPSVIKVFDHNNHGNNHYIAMEFIEGQSLESVLESTKVNFETTILIVRALADALRYIHSQGIIHRDIKPANVMIAMAHEGIAGLRPERIKLMDFGIAVGKVLTRLTMTGARVGTPIYMSPEQAKGQKIDARSDIYSLGLMLYEMVAGQVPFKGSYEVVVHQQVFQVPPPPKQVNPDVPIGLSDLIMKMIEKDPEKRPSLSEVIDAIDAGILTEKKKYDGPCYLAISVNARKGVLRQIEPVGQLIQSVGQLSAAGPFTSAPQSIALDRDGNYYAIILSTRAGTESAKMIHKFSADGQEIFAFGTGGLRPGEFMQPVSLAVSPYGQLYVLDGETCTVQRFSLDGDYYGSFGTHGPGKGTFKEPRMIVVGYDLFLYILDYGNRQIQKFTLEGEYVARYAFKMSKEDPTLRELDGLGVDGAGYLYVSDVPSRKIRRISPEGKAVQSFPLENISGEDHQQPLQIVVDNEGNVFAARAGNHQMQHFSVNGRPLPHIETYDPVTSVAIFIKEGMEMKEAHH